MKSALMGSLKFQIPQLGFHKTLQEPRLPRSSVITCSLRGKPRPPLWRAKRLSTEAIQAIQSLKLARSSTPRLEEVFDSKLSRLLKTDLLDTLAVLQNQNELDLALKVFEFVRKEVWYKPDILLYHAMIQMLGRNKMVEMAEEFFGKLEKEGLKPDTRAFTEMIGAYLQVGMIDKAMETYERMKASGCDPDKLTFRILIRNLEDAGKEELVDRIKKECGDYMDYPKKFLEEVDRKKNQLCKVADKSLNPDCCWPLHFIFISLFSNGNFMLTVNCINQDRENEYTGIAGVMFIHNCKNLCSFLTCIFHIFFPQVKRLVVDFF